MAEVIAGRDGLWEAEDFHAEDATEHLKTRHDQIFLQNLKPQ
jgi:hypothetical protein